MNIPDLSRRGGHCNAMINNMQASPGDLCWIELRGPNNCETVPHTAVHHLCAQIDESSNSEAGTQRRVSVDIDGIELDCHPRELDKRKLYRRCHLVGCRRGERTWSMCRHHWWQQSHR